MLFRTKHFSCFMLMSLSGIVLANHATHAPYSSSLKDTTATPTYHTFFSTFKNKLDAKHPKLSLQLGGFINDQGTHQLINIDGTRGDYFSIYHQNSSNGLVGVGYYLDAKNTSYADFTYGLNAFYLAPTQVMGAVTQEQLFTNLTYGYTITNWPIYFAAKAATKNKYHPQHDITLDVGIGPNIMQTSEFKERALLGSVILDNPIAGQTSVAFAAMAGIGYRMNDVIGSAPLECGYRFFYLGQTNLRNINTQITNHLSTGEGYANALLCAITL